MLQDVASQSTAVGLMTRDSVLRHIDHLSLAFEIPLTKHISASLLFHFGPSPLTRHTKEAGLMACWGTAIFHFFGHDSQQFTLNCEVCTGEHLAYFLHSERILGEIRVIFISFMTYGANLSKAFCLCRPAMLAARLKGYAALERQNIWVTGLKSRERNFIRVSLYY